MRTPLKLLVILAALVLTRLAWAATVTILLGPFDTYLSVGTTTASGSGAISATVTPTGGSATYRKVDCELFLPAPSGTVAINSSVIGWFVGSLDATNFEDGSASVFPARLPDLTWPLRNVSGAQRVLYRGADMPRDAFQVLVKNNGTGVTFAATWTVKCQPWTETVN